MAKKPDSIALAANEIRRLFKCAVAFDRAQSAISDKAMNSIARDPESQMFSAAMTNHAFALELYLKCLHALESGKAPYGHDLEALFDGLPDAIKSKAESYYDRLRRDDPFYADYAKEFQARGGDPAVTFALRSALKTCKDAFEVNRYIYEPGKSPQFFLGPLVHSIRAIILERHTEWDTNGDYASMSRLARGG